MLADRIRFNRVFFRDQVFTGEYLTRAVDDCARRLDAGVRSNSPIVYLHAPNHLKTLVAFLGIVKSGRTCLLVDPAVGALEYDEMLADTRPAAIIRVDPTSIALDGEREIAFTDNRLDPTLAAELDDVCLMLYTAAEDGVAKAAMLTHRNILASAEVIAADNRVDDRSVSCALIPFDHIFGFQYGIVTPLLGNGSVLISDAIDFQRMEGMAEKIAKAAVTHLYSVPIVYYMLGKSSHRSALGKNAHMICGGYKLHPALRSGIQRNFSARLYEGYGLTETTAGCVWQQRTDNDDAPAALGKPVRNCRIDILDDRHAALPTGRVGEICVSGPAVAKGYFNHRQAWATSFIDGRLHTGDLGCVDADGNLFFHGLKKRMFNVAGNKVYPAELSRLLLQHGGVASVELCSTYSEQIGDRITARITLRKGYSGTKDDFSRWLRDNIRPYKIPSTLSFTQE